MFTGPPLPLSPDLSLHGLAQLAGSLPQLGAWVRSGARDLPLYVHAADRRCRILISRDLGFLLGRCRYVAVRQGSTPLVLEADLLIRWRVLQVVTAMPCLPNLELLREIFPEALIESAGFRVPVGSRAPEEILAVCVTHGIPVAESRIVYAPIRS